MYRITNSTSIIRLADSAFIPADPLNRDYAEYLEWLAAGNEPLPYEPPPPAPITAVTMRQARLALLEIGKLQDVETAIDSMPEPTKTIARIEWEYSQEVHRNKELVQALAPALGLTEEDLDNLFILASTK